MTALEQAQGLLAAWAQETRTPEAGRLDVVIAPEKLVAATTALFDARWGYLAGITGLDAPKSGQIEVLYHFCAGAYVLTLRIALAREKPSIASICSVIPAASMFERELAEMFGVAVVGTPDPSRLFLPDDWQDGVYPLRKDFAEEASHAE
ncbi:MAG: NADH-quinone oxidoreductase subunit C [Chloroflexi bacterium]|nr:NADH-quinone oxidoreductase subunit C [Chloroflexota bacterium]